MRNLFNLVLLAVVASLNNWAIAQSGCPGCITDLPALPDDTVYLSSARAGFVNQYYEADISFRLPKTTTAVAAVDSTTPPGFPIASIRINGLANLPEGLSWELSQSSFQTADETDGCVRICGIPLELGFYQVEVQLTASVFGLTRDAAFTFPLTIYPEPDPGIPVVIYGNSGCGSAIVTLVNQIQSNGDPRFTYLWDFGNGQTSTQENPDPVVYDDPGIYILTFEALVDTFPTELSTVKITATTCDDFSLPPFISGNPDLYITILNADGDIVYTSEIKENTNIPVTFTPRFPIEQGNYRLKVWDKDDGGLGGGDDFCGEFIINRQSNGMFTDGNLTLEITTFHPVGRVEITDTIRVFEEPPVPVVSPDVIQVTCRDSLILSSDISDNVTWYFEGNFVANSPSILARESGRYWVVFEDPSSGCKGVSDTVHVPEPLYPMVPEFTNDRNLLYVGDSMRAPAHFSLQWYLDDQVLPGANGFSWCATISGNYRLEIQDLDNGCISTYEALVIWNPDYDCLVGIRQVAVVGHLGIYPNPGVEEISFSGIPKWETGALSVFNQLGQCIVWNPDFPLQSGFNISSWPQGIYWVQINVDGMIYAGKVIKQ